LARLREWQAASLVSDYWLGATKWSTVNFRTPRYDLDSLYERGPVNEPQFYDPADRDKLLVTPNINGVEDMPRDSTLSAHIAMIF
jgi:hypothetical protein